jgi:hypothetical protein
MMQVFYHVTFAVSFWGSLIAQIVFGQVCGVLFTFMWTLDRKGIIMAQIIKGMAFVSFHVIIEMFYVYIQQLQVRVRSKIQENENLFSGMREGVLVLSSDTQGIQFQNKAASKMIQSEGKKLVDVTDLAKPIFNPGKLSMMEEKIIQPSTNNFSIEQIIKQADSKNAVEGEPGHPLTIYKVVDSSEHTDTDEESKGGRGSKKKGERYARIRV